MANKTQKPYQQYQQPRQNPNRPPMNGNYPGNPHHPKNRAGESVQAHPSQTMKQIQAQVLQATETKLANKGVYKNADEMQRMTARPNAAYAQSQKEALDATQKAMAAHKNDKIMRDSVSNAADKVFDALNNTGDENLYVKPVKKKELSKSFGIDTDVEQKSGNKQLSMAERSDRPSKVLTNPVEENNTTIFAENTHQEEDTVQEPETKDNPIVDPVPANNITIEPDTSDEIESPKAETPETPEPQTEETINQPNQSMSAPKMNFLTTNANAENLVKNTSGKFIISGRKDDFSKYLKDHQSDLIGYVGDELGITDEHIENQNVYVTQPEQYKGTTSLVIVYNGFDGAKPDMVQNAVRNVVFNMLTECKSKAKVGKDTYPITTDELSFCKSNFAPKTNEPIQDPSANMQEEAIDSGLEHEYDAAMENYYANMASDMQYS